MFRVWHGLAQMGGAVPVVWCVEHHEGNEHTTRNVGRRE